MAIITVTASAQRMQQAVMQRPRVIRVNAMQNRVGGGGGGGGVATVSGVRGARASISWYS